MIRLRILAILLLLLGLDIGQAHARVAEGLGNQITLAHVFLLTFYLLAVLALLGGALTWIELTCRRWRSGR